MGVRYIGHECQSYYIIQPTPTLPPTSPPTLPPTPPPTLAPTPPPTPKPTAIPPTPPPTPSPTSIFPSTYRVIASEYKADSHMVLDWCWSDGAGPSAPCGGTEANNVYVHTENADHSDKSQLWRYDGSTSHIIVG